MTITESGLLFEAHCKAKRKRFRLSLDLNREVVAENSTWSMAAVGRAMVTLRKAGNTTWPRLLKSSKKPGNMHIWWSMHERYEAENDKLEDEAKADRRAKKKADKQGSESASATATPTPEPTPTPTEFEQRKAELQKEFSKDRKAAEAAHKSAMGAFCGTPPFSLSLLLVFSCAHVTLTCAWFSCDRHGHACAEEGGRRQGGRGEKGD